MKIYLIRQYDRLSDSEYIFPKAYKHLKNARVEKSRLNKKYKKSTDPFIRDLSVDIFSVEVEDEEEN